MIQFYLSKDLAPNLLPHLKTDHAQDENAMCWYGHQVVVMRKHYILMLEATTRYCMLFPVSDKQDLQPFYALFTERLFEDSKVLCKGVDDARIQAMIATLCQTYNAEQGSDRSISTHLRQVENEIPHADAMRKYGISPAEMQDEEINRSLRKYKGVADYFRPLDAFQKLLHSLLNNIPDTASNDPELQQKVEQMTQQWQAAKQAQKKQKPSKKIAPPISLYQLKLNLTHSNPPIWRRVQVHSDIALAALHWIIQYAMGWENYHAYQFVFNKERFGPNAECDDNADSEVKLSELLKKPKDQMQYEYDFGDSWHHAITLEKILPFDSKAPVASCLEGELACPPEDCGGMWGYYHKLEALADPNSNDYQDVAAWMGDDFDPKIFDIKAVNQMLRRLQKSTPK